MDALSTAESFKQQIQARSDAIESAQRMPQDLAQEMAGAGMFRILVPEVYGGAEVHPQTFFDCLVSTAEADGAVGWVSMIANTTSLLSASLPEDIARAIDHDVGDIIARQKWLKRTIAQHIVTPGSSLFALFSAT